MENGADLVELLLFTWTQSAYSMSRNNVTRRRYFSNTPGISDVYLVTNTNREKGLAFEEHVVTLMQSLNCELQATQQSRDGGIDHQGSWTLPDLEVEVVTQCKNERKPVGVHYRFFLRTTHPAILCTVDIVSGRLTSFLLNDSCQTLLPKLTVGSLFVNQEHALVLTYGDKILG
ncbi:unnamed protein product [Peronospora farinosa]|uniref:Restriction endonuclease type IV Mrr domain-containing protein n=1 Tax=Peronospora farinosa TaxID=134698 RepID=A0AAV0UP68_9STRA|nr:unnamed protein product [Peronospora farinosa]CAI5738721.1 unnamed protein product [Peronospora farinosa]